MSALAFELPAALEATAPPEIRGVDRDAVRLMVADRADGSIVHARFDRLPELLQAGDLVVINVSATLPAAVAGRRSDGGPVRVHFATRAPELDESWRVVELRSADGSRPARGRAGETIALAADASLELVAPYASGSRLLLARFDAAVALEEFLARHGEPIRYGYVSSSWPLSAYQNVYAIAPGSAEMPSAGRPFTARLITELVARGIAVAPLTLHTGVSSPERHEPPFAEQYARQRGHRAARELDPRRRRTRDRRRHHGRTRARDDRPARRDRDAGRGLDRPRDRSRARRARRRWPDHRLARARGLAPRDAGGDRRRRAAGALLRRRHSSAATCGTSSATAT